MSDADSGKNGRIMRKRQNRILPAVRKSFLNIFWDNEPPVSIADASYRMRILSFFAISFVVLGHMNFQVSMNLTMTEPMTFQGWFPYYSFHLPLFLFITGYFFRDLPEDRPFFSALLRFVGKKAFKLLLPYYLFSGLSLMLNGWLFTKGFTFGKGFSLNAWLTSPWTEPYLFTFSLPAWYLPALFVSEICLLLLRKAFRLLCKRSLPREILLLAITLAAGIGAAYYNKTASPSQTAIVYLRSVLMLFFMQAGALYRRHLEQHDRLKSPWYFLIVFAAQYLLIQASKNGILSPGLYALTYFGKTYYVYFIGGVTGILLWLRVSTIIASLPRRSRLLVFIGKNTKYIMALHLVSWFLFNTLLSHLQAHHANSVLLSGFSSRWYYTFMFYCHTTNPRMIPVYYAVGMAVPLLIAWLMQGLFAGLRFILRRIKGA